MRNLTPVYVGLVLASAIVSTLLWRELRTERQALQTEQQLTDDLRTQLAKARADLASSLQAQAAAAAVPQPAAIVKAASEVKPAGEVKPAIDVVALVADAAKKQKTLLESSGYRKARLAEVHAALKERNPLLARELGISEQQADAVLDVLAEGQLRQDAREASLFAAGTAPDAAAMAEMTRLQQAQQQEDKSALVSMLGETRYAQLQDVEQTQAARTRVVNLKTLLVQSGQPLSNDQMLSLTKVMATEQKREEQESKELRDSGRIAQVSQVDRAVEGDRRILDGVASFLNTQQIETVRTRFEQRQAMERATGSVTARERQSPN